MREGESNGTRDFRRYDDYDDDDEFEELDPSDIVEVIDLDDNGASNGSDLSEDDVEHNTTNAYIREDSISARLSAPLQCFTSNEERLPIYRCCLCPNNESLVALGGDDQNFVLWNAESNVELLRYKFNDSVDSVAFNKDGTYVAVGDMRGTVAVWKLRNLSNIDKIADYLTSDLACLKWHPKANVLCASSEDGQLWVWKVPEGDYKFFQGPLAKLAVFCFLPNGKDMLAGFDNGEFRLWDIKESKTLSVIKGASEEEVAVTDLVINKAGTIALSSHSSGYVKVISLNTKTITDELCCNSDDQTTGVESVAFSDNEQFFAAATLSGELLVFTVSNYSIYTKFTNDSRQGIMKLIWNDENSIFIAGLDGCVHLIDIRSGFVINSYHCHKKMILDFHLSSDHNKFITSADDGTSKLFAVFH